MTAPKATKRQLSDFKPDIRNANKHTQRGMSMLEDSLQTLGAGRSILVDRNNNVIAGNATLETAVATGFEDAIVVPTDGKQLVIVQRTDIDLDSPQGRKLAITDNRIAEVDLSWSSEELQALADDGVDLSGLFFEHELDEILNSDAGAELREPGMNKRMLGDKRQQVKAVLYVDEVGDFERALKATGLVNRGEALLMVCRAYLKAAPDEA